MEDDGLRDVPFRVRTLALTRITGNRPRIRLGDSLPRRGAHFRAFAAAGFSCRWVTLERPPAGPRFFRRRGEREPGRRPGEARMVQSANNNFRKIRLIIVMNHVSTQ